MPAHANLFRLYAHAKGTFHLGRTDKDVGRLACGRVISPMFEESSEVVSLALPKCRQCFGTFFAT
jgi:hypothetical protein